MDCRSRQAAPGPSQARVITRTRGARSSPPGREPSGRRSGVGRRVGGGKATTPVAGSPSEASESSVRAGLVREALTSSSRAGPSWEHLSMKGTPAGEAALIDVRSAEAVLAPAATLGFTRERRGRDWGVRGGIASLRSRSTTPRRDGAARCGAPSLGRCRRFPRSPWSVVKRIVARHRHRKVPVRENRANHECAYRRSVAEVGEEHLLPASRGEPRGKPRRRGVARRGGSIP
jgi:hypothetical protein